MERITMTKREYTLKNGTKNVWIQNKCEVSDISREQHKNIINAAPFFRMLGGSEYHERCFTPFGYNVYRITSKSPNRSIKIVREFDFTLVEQ